MCDVQYLEALRFNTWIQVVDSTSLLNFGDVDIALNNMSRAYGSEVVGPFWNENNSELMVYHLLSDRIEKSDWVVQSLEVAAEYLEKDEMILFLETFKAEGNLRDGHARFIRVTRDGITTESLVPGFDKLEEDQK
jgi:hypothetical protein